jgi:hypothetical protein
MRRWVGRGVVREDKDAVTREIYYVLIEDQKAYAAEVRVVVNMLTSDAIALCNSITHTLELLLCVACSALYVLVCTAHIVLNLSRCGCCCQV